MRRLIIITALLCLTGFQASAQVALVANGLIVGSASGGASGSLSTAPATELFVVVAEADLSWSGGEVVVTDAVASPACASPCNTWIALTGKQSGGASPAPRSIIFHADNPHVGTGHVFTIAHAFCQCAAGVLAFSGVKTVAPLDTQDGNFITAATATIAAGATGVTPSAGNALIVTGSAWGSGGATLTIGSGFTVTNTQNFVPANTFGIVVGYLVQSVAAFVNPTHTSGSGPSNTGAASTIAAFKGNQPTGRSRMIQ